jgi:hypothetical protein
MIELLQFSTELPPARLLHHRKHANTVRVLLPLMKSNRQGLPEEK